MGKATSELIKEHEVIKRALSLLSEIVSKINENNVSKDQLIDFIQFFKIFADKNHHGKEEQILFEKMISKGFSRESGPIAVMLYEHTIGRGLIKSMSDAIEQNSIDEFKNNAVSYINLLNEHIDKENNILFAMADRLISNEEQEQIYLQYLNFEKQSIGESKNEVKNKLKI